MAKITTNPNLENFLSVNAEIKEIQKKTKSTEKIVPKINRPLRKSFFYVKINSWNEKKYKN